MIANHDQSKQLPNEIKSTFKELKVLKHLRKAGITKSFGFTCAYLFQLIFCLIFENKNWFRTLESKKSTDIPAKDEVYRFLNRSTYSWRRFLLLLSAHSIEKVSKLTNHERIKVLIVDDSSYDKNRSKSVELLARCFDHASQKMRFYKGFRMLTLGWSDGTTFMPVDFSLLSSKNSVINGVSQNIDKRSSGYKRRLEALQTAPDLMKGKKVSLKELYSLASPVQGKKGILRSIQTTQANGVPVKIVFVRNRNKKSEWLAILSTDCSLSEQEIIRIYGIRWDIEVFFKTTKSLLKLQKEFQGRSYDSLICHTTIVFTRYIVLSWQNRCSTDQRTLGGLFYDLCDEISDLDWAVALGQLLELLQDVLKESNKRIQKLIQCQLQHWIAGLPNYIKVYLPISVCES
ncbi:IS4 family transposase ISDha5 [Bacillus sp. T2.9-1]|uniref:IS4 family transposase n=1 Tax=Bacillus sp. T2.9-1 TaxID=3041163 RepID=UPI0024776E16|nr:transposase [Bacillus sp. T2.9-1]CAI9387555.1 IS4 family transposase ISDha5 [Bacillus sp. T2.9-1]